MNDSLTPPQAADHDDPGGDHLDRRRVVIVGPCASGKSTLARGLRELGYEASVSGQEHSDIPTLWRRRKPDILIGLQVDLETIRHRRGRSWPEAIFERQRRRLTVAMAAADLILDSATLNSSQVLAETVRILRGDRATRARDQPLGLVAGRLVDEG